MGYHHHNLKLIGRKTQAMRERNSSKLLLLFTIPITPVDLNSLRIYIYKKKAIENSRILSSF
jgi:hypothetical protein